MSQKRLHVCVIEFERLDNYNEIDKAGQRNTGKGSYGMDKFVIMPKKDDKSLTVTVRVSKALLDEYDDLAVKTNRSRNELICMALQYALDNKELHGA